MSKELSQLETEFYQIITKNELIVQILGRLQKLDVPECWLTSGCLVQTVWNYKHGKDIGADIKDYDVVYFDEDISYGAEDRIIKEIQGHFSDLPVRIQARNQARVSLWYKDKYHIDYPQLKTAVEGLEYFPSKTSAIALRIDDTGRPKFSAPFGLSLALDMTLEPNKRLAIKNVYDEKVKIWKSSWPKLHVGIW